MDFAHLHLHTHYSFRDSLVKPDELALRASEYGYANVAVTDHGHISSWIDFYTEMRSEDINPVLGVEAYFVPDIVEKESKCRHVTLLAMNNTGYRNLIHMMSVAGTDGFYYTPRTDKNMLEEYSEGVFCLSGCSYSGLMGQGLTLLDSVDYARWFQSVFDDRFMLEIMPHTFDQQAKANRRALLVSKVVSVPLVLTSDVHYIDKVDSEAHDMLMVIQNRDPYSQKCFWFKSQDEVEEDIYKIGGSWKSIMKDAAEMAFEVANSCNVDIEFGNFRYPKFQVPTNDKGFNKWLRQNNT